MGGVGVGVAAGQPTSKKLSKITIHGWIGMKLGRRVKLAPRHVFH